MALGHAFLAKCACANAKDRRDAPALPWAVGSGKTDCLWMLLDSGADANAKDTEGTSAIALLRRKNKADLLEILVAAGAKEESAKKK